MSLAAYWTGGHQLSIETSHGTIGFEIPRDRVLEVQRVLRKQLKMGFVT
jgi:hypothetical protein